VNQKLCDILGYAREELLGHAFQELTHPDDLQADLDNVNRMLTGEIQTYTMEKRYLRKGGEPISVQLTVSLARGPQNEPRYFISIVEDATQRKHLEEQLRHSQKMEAVGRLAGGVAHDFNNLLTVISGYAEMIRIDPAADEKLRGHAGTIGDASERAAALTRQLLAFSRRQIVQTRVVDLNDLVVNMENMLQRLIGETVALRTVPHARPAKVRVDPGQIEQVIVNLAVNARDAMPEGGSLTIAVGGGPAGRVTLEVRDTGEGMTPEVRSHLFEPFFTTKPHGKGTGLGLSIVYGIVKQAGGAIDVETQPGSGTTFRIELPEIAGELVPAESEVTRGGGAKATETLLLVEDEEVLRKLAAEILRSNGYQVMEASSGEEALKICEGFSGTIPMLVTDMIMPGMNGRALADKLRATHPGMKVLYMSGYTDNLPDLKDSATGFLQKPFVPGVLVRRVRELLDA